MKIYLLFFKNSRDRVSLNRVPEKKRVPQKRGPEKNCVLQTGVRKNISGPNSFPVPTFESKILFRSPVLRSLFFSDPQFWDTLFFSGPQFWDTHYILFKSWLLFLLSFFVLSGVMLHKVVFILFILMLTPCTEQCQKLLSVNIIRILILISIVREAIQKVGTLSQ